MSTVSTVATKLRIATAATAIAAAATLTPAVAHAIPAAPLPAAGVGSTLGSGDVEACDPSVSGDCVAAALAAPGDPIVVPGNLVWLGSPANEDFQPLFGIAFWNPFGFNFEACLFGAAVVLGPYGTGFVGLGLGC